jgi:transposase-like protein
LLVSSVVPLSAFSGFRSPREVIDQHGEVVDVMLSASRDLCAARAFFARALTVGVAPTEVTTDRAPAYPRVLDEYLPAGGARR